MVSERITVTLPNQLARQLRKRAQEQHRPISQLVADALQRQEDERYRELMLEGYREWSTLNRELAEDALPANQEVLPPD